MSDSSTSRPTFATSHISSLFLLCDIPHVHADVVRHSYHAIILTYPYSNLIMDIGHFLFTLATIVLRLVHVFEENLCDFLDFHGMRLILLALHMCSAPVL